MRDVHRSVGESGSIKKYDGQERRGRRRAPRLGEMLVKSRLKSERFVLCKGKGAISKTWDVTPLSVCAACAHAGLDKHTRKLRVLPRKLFGWSLMETPAGPIDLEPHRVKAVQF